MSKFINNIYEITGWSKEDWLLHSTCPKCKDNYLTESQNLDRLYYYQPNQCYLEGTHKITINVGEAFRIIEKTNKSYTYIDDLRVLQTFVDQNKIYDDHINHLQGNPPGIVISFDFHRKDTGRSEQVMVLAEGNYRAAFSIKKQQLFNIFYFNSEETKKLIIK